MREILFAAALTGAFYAGVCAGLLWLAGLGGVGVSLAFGKVMVAVAVLALASMAVARR